MTLRGCSYCSASFSKAEHLKRHERTHTGEKPYTCRFCSKRFSRGDVLKRHVRGHMGEGDDDDGGGPDCASPSRRRSTSRATVDMAHDPSTLGSAQDLDRLHFPAPTDLSCLPLDVESRMIQAMPTPDRGQQQQQNLTGAGDLSTMLGLPHTPGSTASPDFSNPWDVFFFSMGSPGPSDARADLSRKHSLGSDIPDERFTKLARLWPKKGPPQWSLMQMLWADAACHKGANLFSEPPSQDNNNNYGNNGSDDSRHENHHDNHSNNSPHLRSIDSQRDLDDARRLSLIRFMHPHLENESDPQNPPSPRFPTADTLAVCIDHYFQRFHPLFPFIHEPTFSAKQTPNIMLAPICLIGLHLLNPNATRTFVANQISRTIEKCNVALSRTWDRADWAVLVTALGASVLLLNYASVLEDECAYSTQTYNLYVRALTVAQENGLFDVSRGSSPSEAMPLQQRDEHFWEGWAKIESAKRLTACLVATESLYTSRMGLKPIIQVDRLHIYAPCSNDMFHASRGDRCANVATAINLTYIDPCNSDFQGQSIALPSSTIANTVAMHTLLSALSLCISNLKVNNLMHDNDPARNILYPAETFQNSTTGVALAQLLQAIHVQHGETLLATDPNATVLWHFMCMNMSANLNLFELAAGREGIEVGKVALEKILVWAHSPYARRACLHAAQVYVCMMGRMITDGTTFMSEIALFNAALVVGLYVYASPSTLEGDTEPPLELLDKVDWSQIGDGGFPGWDPSRNDPTYAASKFISRGGPICFNKMKCHGGYMSSRRVILNYVGLLGEVGRWNWHKFRHILRVMSDSMVELETE